MTAYCHSCLQPTDGPRPGYGSANDAIQSLSRIGQATARWMAEIHRSGSTRDPEEELAHIRANVDHLARIARVDA